MPLVDPVPSSPLLPAIQTLVSGLSGATYAQRVRDAVNALVTRGRTQQANAEALVLATLGDGWISGGAVTAGTWPTVAVASLTAVVGNPISVTGPLTLGPLGNGENYVWIWTNGSATLTASATPPVDVSRGRPLLWATVTTDGTAVTAIDNARAVFTPWRPSFGFVGVPGSTQHSLPWVAPRALTLPVGCPGSRAVARVAATGAPSFSVRRNGTEIATVAWAAAGTVGAFTNAGADAIAAGDVLEVYAPGSADGTLAGIAISLALMAG